jgi:hypothetical protein
LAAHPAQDDNDVSLRICSRDTIRHLLLKLFAAGDGGRYRRTAARDGGSYNGMENQKSKI